MRYDYNVFNEGLSSTKLILNLRCGSRVGGAVLPDRGTETGFVVSVGSRCTFGFRWLCL